MKYRKATLTDIEALHEVRMSVRENVLERVHLVTFNAYKEMLAQHGCGWVCEEVTGRIAGFSIVDLNRQNVWALFVHPHHEGKGIGRILHHIMLEWSFEHGADFLWLTTEPGTRAAKFYQQAGWRVKGVDPSGELRFEITRAEWKLKQQ